ncbi:MAG: cupin domain-containing protein [Sulfitobacter sp.]
MPDLSTEFESHKMNGRVGDTLVSETDQFRIWHIHAKPGDRLAVHRHQLDYFWTIHGPGRARSYFSDGRVVDVTYQTGDTKHFTFASGDSMTHSLENIGETDLIFTTVEFLNSANPPLLLD